MYTGAFAELSKNDILYNLLKLPQLIFEVTDMCNLRCKYCGYADLYEGYDKREIQINEMVLPKKCQV